MILCRVTVFLLLCVGLCCVRPADARDYNPAHWMYDLRDVIYNQTLFQVTLPGSHDSGSYYFTDTFSPIDPYIIEKLATLCYDLGIDIYKFIKRWSLTQDTTIYQQLSGGLRYLDLRAIHIQNAWYTQHFLVGQPTQVLLNDIKRFMTENPGEVIVIELGELTPVNLEWSLVEIVFNTLGQWLAPPMDLSTTTIGEMVAKNQRIVTLWGGNIYVRNATFLWNRIQWKEGNYANNNSLPDMIQWNTNEIMRLGGQGKIFEMSFTLTPQTEDIIRSLLFNREKTLKDLALEANGALDAFFAKYHNYQLSNIILVDFWDFSNIVNLTVNFNLRNCHDTPPYVAWNSNGQYCRNFASLGYCSDPQHEHMMNSYCRLSCGLC